MSLQFDQSGVFHTFCNICHSSHTQKCSDAKFQLGFIFMKNCTTSKIALENLSVTWRWTATQRIPIFFSLKSRALLILDVGLFAQSYWWRCISVGHGYLLRHVQFFIGGKLHLSSHSMVNGTKKISRLLHNFTANASMALVDLFYKTKPHYSEDHTLQGLAILLIYPKNFMFAGFEILTKI